MDPDYRKPVLQPLAVDVMTAAYLAGCSRTALYKYISDGDLKSLKVGRARRILVSDLEAWMQTLRDPSPEQD